ncbi:ImmA/IrrE family metallo-endopeptidase [Myceligenerans halotolerans]
MRTGRTRDRRTGERATLVAHGLDRARSLDEAIDIVKRLRARTIEVVDQPLGEGLSGMWLGFPGCDRIIVNSESALSPRHREFIVAHELMHILEAVNDPSQERNSATRSGYDDPTEHRVESLACALMMSIQASGGVADRLTAMGTFA